jgi:hypothetical protein
MTMLLGSIQQSHMSLLLYLSLDLALTLYLMLLFIHELILDIVVVVIVEKGIELMYVRGLHLKRTVILKRSV